MMIRAPITLLLTLSAASCGTDAAPVSQAVAAQMPPDCYREAERQAIALAREGKTAEAERIFDSWIKKQPDFLEPHFQLATALLFTADDTKDQGLTPERRRILERAATHFRRFVELAGDAPTRAQGLDSLVEVYLRGNLNRPQEAEPHARALITAAPDWPQSYLQFAAVMRQLGRGDEATQVLLDARKSIAAGGRLNFVRVLRTHVAASPTLRGATVKPLLDAAISLADEDLKAARHFGNLTLKAELLELQAERAGESASRQKALQAEAARLRAEAEKL